MLWNWVTAKKVSSNLHVSVASAYFMHGMGMMQSGSVIIRADTSSNVCYSRRDVKIQFWHKCLALRFCREVLLRGCITAAKSPHGLQTGGDGSVWEPRAKRLLRRIRKAGRWPASHLASKQQYGRTKDWQLYSMKDSCKMTTGEGAEMMGGGGKQSSFTWQCFGIASIQWHQALKFYHINS